jgi:hypothetical protein
VTIDELRELRTSLCSHNDCGRVNVQSIAVIPHAKHDADPPVQFVAALHRVHTGAGRVEGSMPVGGCMTSTLPQPPASEHE